MHEVGWPRHASTEQLSALLDDRADADDPASLHGHVAACDVCTGELDGLRDVRDLLRALPVQVPPRSFTIPVSTPRPIRRRGRLVAVTRSLSAVAAVFCVLFFSADAMLLDRPVPMAATSAADAMRTAAPTTGSAARAPVAAQAPAGQSRPASDTAASASSGDVVPKTAEGSGRAGAEYPAPAAAAAVRPAEPRAADAKPAAAPPPPSAAQPPVPVATVTAFAGTQVAVAPTMPPPLGQPGTAPAIPTMVTARPPAAQPAELAPPAPAARAEAPTPSPSRVLAGLGPGISPLRAASLLCGALAVLLLIGSFLVGQGGRLGAGRVTDGRVG